MSKVLICGVGAIGSNLTANLAADLRNEAELIVLDFDTIEERNVTAGTQFYMPDQVGMLKVETLQYNIYKWFGKEINTQNKEVLEPEELTVANMHESYDLVVDCFDNNYARKIAQGFWEKANVPTLHCGFSPLMTFEVTWAENYQVPEDSPEGSRDICEMPGARAFIQRVAGLSAQAVREFIVNGNKIGYLGNAHTSHKLA